MIHTLNTDEAVEAVRVVLQELNYSLPLDMGEDERARMLADVAVHTALPFIRHEIAKALREEREEVIEDYLRRGFETNSAFLAGAKVGYNLSVSLAEGIAPENYYPQE